jgi:hypothetical protein
MYYCSIFVDQEYNHGLAVPSDSESLTGFNWSVSLQSLKILYKSHFIYFAY